jgi:hypothetical protein
VSRRFSQESALAAKDGRGPLKSQSGIDVKSALVYTVVFIRRRGAQYHVITAWPSKRKQILLWHREMKKK